MALHWNIENCKDVDELKGEKGWIVTENLIWITLAVDMGSITKKNWKEFFFRVKVLEKLNGPFLYGTEDDPSEEGKTKQKDIYYTVEMIKKRIGLYTNVVTKTRAAWKRRIFDQALSDIQRVVDREVKQAETPSSLEEVKTES